MVGNRQVARWGRVTTALVLALSTAACSDGSARRAVGTTTTMPSGGAATGGSPVAGDCLEPMTPAVADAAQLPERVACDEAHGGEVVAVYEVDGDTYPAVSGEPVGVDSARSRCLGTGTELGEGDRFAGDSRLESPAVAGLAVGNVPAWFVSSLEPTLFVPSPAAWVRGERWAACAVVLKHSSVELSTYEGSARGVRRPGDLDAAFGWCRNEDQGERIFEVVDCTGAHVLEQVASFTVPAESYPGDRETSTLAAEVCPPLVSTATGGRFDADTSTHGLSWTYPTESEWASGDRTARCYITALGEPTAGTFASSPTD